MVHYSPLLVESFILISILGCALASCDYAKLQHTKACKLPPKQRAVVANDIQHKGFSKCFDPPKAMTKHMTDTYTACFTKSKDICDLKSIEVCVLNGLSDEEIDFITDYALNHAQEMDQTCKKVLTCLVENKWLPAKM